MSLVYLISGTRNLDARDWRTQGAITSALMSHPLPAVMVHGACEGVDRFAASHYFATLRVKTIAMPAQWKRDMRSAGPKRNTEMVTVVSALVRCGWEAKVFAFPRGESKGTRDLIAKAERAGLPVVVTELE